ncbi:hypothetical protein J2W42_002748 [Rhizobium tibeticum]|uniref:DUF6602 domain-containing protein n=1 Tax=Rhizobium tibeticum TaxID=501024 RepID=UPI00278604CB|nr:DUF6602 domain-containing protein [Rhizobium tibeticum]MDP9809889.1 hypothetical protein [Rhizobium tibeticum]
MISSDSFAENNLDRAERLFRTFQGHYFQLLADFHRSAAHKLPGGKGMLREDSVARFLSTWIPKRFEVLSNVFPSQFGSNFDRELDLVVLDTFEGMAWPLDSGGVNSVVTWDHVKLVVEVKSKLNQATWDTAVATIKELPCQKPGNGYPMRLLFAFEVEDTLFETARESFVMGDRKTYPFDAFVFLDKGVYISDAYELFRKGFAKGLGPELAARDGDIIDAELSEELHADQIPNGFRHMHSPTRPETLFAFAAIAAHASAGNPATQALLSACRKPDYNPIFGDDEKDGKGEGIQDATIDDFDFDETRAVDSAMTANTSITFAPEDFPFDS